MENGIGTGNGDSNLTDRAFLSKRGGMSKVDRYAWKMLGKRGEHIRVDKYDLKFDRESYQRPEQMVKVRAIAGKWCWAAAGTVSVARRGTSLYVLDGQQRTLAALLRADIQDIDCMVYDLESIESEAEVFLIINTLRKALTGADKHRGMLGMRDEIATLVQRLVDASGREISSTRTGPKYVKCVRQMHTLAKNQPDALIRAWPVVCEVCDGHTLKDRVLQALVLIESRLEYGESLTSKRWRGRLMSLGYDGINTAIESAAAYYTTGGAKVWARGVVDAMNRGLRTRKLVPRGLAGE